MRRGAAREVSAVTDHDGPVAQPLKTGAARLGLTLKDSIVPTPTGPGAPAQTPPLAAFQKDNTATLYLKAAARFEENKCLGEAAAQLEKARKANSDLDVSYRLARLYEALEKYPEARAEYNNELATARQEDADLLNGILTGLKKMVGRPVEKSRQPDLLNDISYCLYLKGDFAESESCLNQALELKADYAEARGNLGFTLAAQDRIEDSLNAFQHVVNPPAAYFNVAFEQAKHDKIAEAKESYGKALELDPQNKMARSALTQLEQVEKKEAALSATPGHPE
jgi:tetratricopeptide (TPR) repeat protein